MIDIFKNIETVVGCIVTIMGLLTLIIKPIRKWIIEKIRSIVHHDEYTNNITELKELFLTHINESTGIFQDIRDSMQANNDGTLNSLRYQIYELTEIIFERGYIKEKERELLTDMHTAYRKLGGNSYISDRVNRAFHMETRD
jgi:hypothetical protein